VKTPEYTSEDHRLTKEIERMTSRNNHVEQEIQEIISSIKKTFRDSFKMDSSTIELVHNHLLKLQEYLTHLDNAHDLSSVVSEFIESLTNLHGLLINHAQVKLSLKSNITVLEEAFLNFRRTNCYEQLLFIPGFSFRHYHEDS